MAFLEPACVYVCSVSQSCPAFSDFMVYHKASALAGSFFTSVPPGEPPRTSLLWQPYCLEWVCWEQLGSRKGIKQICIVPTASSFLVSPCLWHLTLLKSSDHLQSVPEFEFSVSFFFVTWGGPVVLKHPSGGIICAGVPEIRLGWRGRGLCHRPGVAMWPWGWDARRVHVRAWVCVCEWVDME